MSNMKELVAVTQRDPNKKGFWTRIGTAFENKDGSWSLAFDFMPLNTDMTKIQMRDIREKTDKPATPPATPTGYQAADDKLPF